MAGGGATGDLTVADHGGPGEADFGLFYAANVDRMVAQLLAYTNDLAQAQDVVQEAFARALPRWSRLCRYDDPAAWVHRVAWNLATSRWRQVSRFRAFAVRQRSQEVPGPEPDRVVLAAALARLPGKQRQAVILHYLDDLPVAQIAIEMGATESTVKSWLHRGRHALAAVLTDAEEEGRHV